jgi:uncharacterized membrane protein YbhN (UPF0104 family)
VSAAAPVSAAVSAKRFHIHWKRLLVAAVVLVVVGAAANLLGWDIKGWLHDVWHTVSSISLASLITALAFKTVQTTLTAFAWYSILRFAYPGKVRWLDILACYAASVALNGILPANLGTLAMLIMFTTIIAGVTFAGVLGSYAIEKIFFTLIGAFVYLYLFLSVGGSFDLKFGFVKSHPWGTAILLVGVAFLIYLLARAFWPHILKWWEEAKVGGGIIVHPGLYFGRVFLPSLLAWFAGLAVMAVFLHAYGIPNNFHTLMRISGGNSLSNVTSATPGGAGVNQAFSVASLRGITSSANATAYSVAQQFFTTAWNIIFAIIMLAWAFGWSGGEALVKSSYTQAKEKTAEQHAARKESKRAKRAAKA